MNLMKHNQLLELGQKLLESPWPKCDQIARQIYEMGGEEAKDALLKGPAREKPSYQAGVY